MSFTPLQVNNPAQPYAAIRVQIRQDDLAGKIPDLLTEVHDWLTAHRIPVAGPALIRYCSIGESDGDITVEVGFPIESLFTATGGSVEFGELPAGTYVIVVHRGPYDTLRKTTGALLEWGIEHSTEWDILRSADQTQWRGRVEHYLIGPQTETDSAHWHTEIAILKR